MRLTEIRPDSIGNGQNNKNHFPLEVQLIWRGAEQKGKPTYRSYSSIPIEHSSGPRAGQSEAGWRDKMAGNRRGVLGKQTSQRAHKVRCKAQNRSTEFWIKEEKCYERLRSCGWTLIIDIRQAIRNTIKLLVVVVLLRNGGFLTWQRQVARRIALCFGQAAVFAAAVLQDVSSRVHPVLCTPVAEQVSINLTLGDRKSFPVPT